MSAFLTPPPVLGYDPLREEEDAALRLPTAEELMGTPSVPEEPPMMPGSAPPAPGPVPENDALTLPTSDQLIEYSQRMQAAQPVLSPEQVTTNKLIGAMQAEQAYAPETSDINYLRSRIPFVGPAMGAIDNIRVYQAANRIKENAASDEDFTTVGRFLALNDYESAQREKAGFGKRVWDIVSGLPGFMAEFASTMGVGKAASAAAKEAIGRGGSTLVGKIAARAAAGSAGAAAMAGAMPQRVAENTTERMLPKFGVREDKTIEIKDGDSLVVAVPKGFLDTFIEVATERMGSGLAPLSKLGKLKAGKVVSENLPVVAKMRDYIVQKWVNAVPGRTMAMANSVLRKGGYDGILSEMMEERAGEIARGLVPGMAPDFGTTGQLFDEKTRGEALRQLAVEAAAFAVPGAAAKGPAAGIGLLDKVLQRIKPEPPADERMETANTAEMNAALGAMPKPSSPEAPPPAAVQAPVAAPVGGEYTEEPAKGTVRVYHGGTSDGNGPRWFSPDLDYAQGYAEKSGGDVSYIDLPEDSPLLRKAFDDTGTDQKAPYVSFEAPEEIAKQRKPYRPPVDLTAPIDTVDTLNPTVQIPKPGTQPQTTPPVAEKPQPARTPEAIDDSHVLTPEINQIPESHRPLAESLGKAFGKARIGMRDDGKAVRVEFSPTAIVDVELSPGSYVQPTEANRKSLEKEYGKERADKMIAAGRAAASIRYVQGSANVAGDAMALIKVSRALTGDVAKTDSAILHEAVHFAKKYALIEDSHWKALEAEFYDPNDHRSAEGQIAAKIGKVKAGGKGSSVRNKFMDALRKAIDGFLKSFGLDEFTKKDKASERLMQMMESGELWQPFRKADAKEVIPEAEPVGKTEKPPAESPIRPRADVLKALRAGEQATAAELAAYPDLKAYVQKPEEKQAEEPVPEQPLLPEQTDTTESGAIEQGLHVKKPKRKKRADLDEFEQQILDQMNAEYEADKPVVIEEILSPDLQRQRSREILESGAFKAGDRVEWQLQKKKLTGTVTGVDVDTGQLEIDVDQIAKIGGRIPIRRREYPLAYHVKLTEAAMPEPEAEKPPVAPESAEPQKPKRPTAVAADKAKQDMLDAWAALRDKLKDKGIPSNPMLDPDLQVAAVKAAAATVRYGVTKFADFVAQAVEIFGEPKVRQLGDLLRRAWNAAGNLPAYKGKLDAGRPIEDVLGEVSHEPQSNADVGSTGPAGNAGVEDGTRLDGGAEAEGAGGVSEGRPDRTGEASEPGGAQLPADNEPAGQGDAGPGRVPEAGDRDQRSDAGPQRVGRQRAADIARVVPASQVLNAEREGAENHRIRPDDVIVPRGDVGKIRANIDAIEALKRLESENRAATPEEQKTLAQYTGWGQLPQVFDNIKAEAAKGARGGYFRDENWEKKYLRFYDRISELLTPEEWREAAATVLNAHYTSRPVIESIWKMAERAGFIGGRVLEPGAGVGHFIGLAPEGVAENSTFFPVEMDGISAKIIAALYPQAAVINEDMNKVKLMPNSVDLVVGNVPFFQGNQPDSEPRYGRPLNLHNYMIARGLDALKPGGVAILISTHHTMDSQIDQRRLLADKADLVAAYRLPNNAFDENAGTEVTTDILVFRKPDSAARHPEPWTSTAQIPTGEHGKRKNKKGEDEEFEAQAGVNEYYVAHPENVFGTHSMAGKMRGQPAELQEYTVKPTDTPITDLLAAGVDRLPSNIIGGSADVGEAELPGEEGESHPEGTIYLKGKQVYLSADGKEIALKPGVQLPDGYPKLLSGAAATARAVHYVGLRDHYAGHRRMMLSSESSDEQIAESRKKLNALYDDYVRRHGHFDEQSSRVFREDPDFWHVAALESKKERFDEQNRVAVTYEKAAVFTERTVQPWSPPASVQTFDEALFVSLSHKAAINAPFMAELLGKPLEEIEKELGDSKLTYLDPETGLWEQASHYLSGNVVRKLEQAKVAAEDEEKYKRNVEALEKVIPARRPIEKIKVRFQDAWIPEQVFSSFLRSLGVQNAVVRYNKATDSWEVGGHASLDADEAHATGRVPLTDMAELSLNMKFPVVKDMQPKDPDGSRPPPVLNPQETQLARAAQSRLHTKFNEWVHSNENAGRVVEEAYNTSMNSHITPKWDGSHLTLPGLSSKIEMRPYQLGAIWRMLVDGRALLAHAVGSGKTYTMVAAAMEMRRLKMAKRPMIVVQNATLEQFAAAVTRLYPGANILVAGKDDLQKDNRKLFLSKVVSGNWDAIIVAQSTFDRLQSSQEMLDSYFQEMIDDLQAALEDRREAEGKNAPSVKEIQTAIRSLQEKWDKMSHELAGSLAENPVTFEQLGVDALFVDEAHAYKKPFFVTKLQNLVGLNKKPSLKSINLMMKVRHVREKTGGRNIFLATGTPITNTMGESWHMINYLNPQVLAEFNSETFDRFVSSFAEVANIRKMNAGGNWVMKEAIVKFKNGQAFGNMLRQTWDIVSPADLRAYLAEQSAKTGQGGIPKLRSGKATQVVVDRTPGVAAFMEAYIKDAYDAFGKLTGQAKKDWGFIPAIMYGAAKYAAIDIRLVSPSARPEKGSKIDAAVERILEEYNNSKERKGVQAVFSNVINPYGMGLLDTFVRETGGQGIHATIADTAEEAESGEDLISEAAERDSFVFKEIKRKLIEGGIPESEIALVAEHGTEKKREKLWDDAKSGRVRVLMGSTERMGIGVNIQDRMVALHHLDAVWVPGDIEQRDGRILRFGNMNDEVAIYKYAMKNTLDSAIIDGTMRKAKGIWQAMEGKYESDEFDDPASEFTMSADEMIAAIEDNPLYFEKLELDNSVRELRFEKDAYDDGIIRQKQQIETFKRNKEVDERSAKTSRDSANEVQAEFDKKPEIKVGQKSSFAFDDVAEAGKAMDELLKNAETHVIKEVESRMAEHEKSGRLGNRVVDETVSISAAAGPVRVTVVITGTPIGTGIDGKAHARIMARTVSHFTEVDDNGKPINPKGYFRTGAETGRGLIDAMLEYPERIGKEADRLDESAKEYGEKIPKLEELVKRPWPNEEELARKSTRLAEVDQALVVQSQQKEQEREHRREARRNPQNVREFDESKGEEKKPDEEPPKLLGSQPAGVVPVSTSKKPEKPPSMHDIRATLEKDFDTKFLRGRVNKPKAAGIYNWQEEISRLLGPEWGNLGVITHELAHHVDKRYDPRPSAPTAAIQEMEKLDYKPTRGDPKEGFAEFVRYYLTDDIAPSIAPATFQWFTQHWLPDHPVLKAKFDKAKRLISAWRNASPLDRGAAEIWSRGRTAKALEQPIAEQAADLILTTAMRAGAAMYDEYLYPKRLDVLARSKGGGLNQETPFHRLVEVAAGADKAQMEEALKDGVYTLGEHRRKLYKSFREVIAPIAEKFEAWNAYLDAKAAVELRERFPGYNPGLPMSDYEWIIDHTSEADKELFGKVNEDFRGYHGALVDVLVESGVYTVAEGNRIKDSREVYMPRIRLRETGLVNKIMGGFHDIRRSIFGVTRPIRRQSEKGGTDAYMDAIEATVSRTAEVFNAANHQDIRMSFLRSMIPSLGGADGMGKYVTEVAPKKYLDPIKLELLLDELSRPHEFKGVERDAIITEQDAKLIKLVSRLRWSGANMKQEDLEWLAARYGVDLESDTAIKDLIIESGAVPDLEQALAVWRQDFGEKPNEHILRVVHNGRVHLIQVVDGDLYHALMGLGNRLEGSTLGRVLSTGTRLWDKVLTTPLKMGAVALTPSFAPINLIMDYAAFVIQSKETGYLERFALPIQGVWLSGIDFLKGFTGGKRNPYLELFAASGGKLDTRFGTVRKAAKTLKGELLAQTAGQKLVAKIRPGNVLNTITELTAIGEAGVRIPEFTASIHNQGYHYDYKKDSWVDTETMEPVKFLPRSVVVNAAIAANEVTTNFRKKGYVARVGDRMIPFFSAQIAGRVRNIQGAIELLKGPGKEKRLLGMAMLLTFGALAWAMGHDEDWYKGMDPEMKNKYWFFGMPGGPPMFRLPKPRGYGAIVNFLESMLEWTVDGKTDRIPSVIMDEAKETLPNRPSGLSTLYEIAQNKDIWGRDIEPRHMVDAELYKTSRVKPYTTETAKALAKYLSHEQYGLSPIQAEYIANQWMGGFYSETVGTAEGIVKGTIQPATAPVARRFLLKSDYQRSVRDFYDEQKQLKGAVNTAKHNGKKDEARERQLSQFGRYADVMSDVWKAASQAKDADQKRDLERWAVGMADYALGNQARKLYPNPLATNDTPDVLKDDKGRTPRQAYAETLIANLTKDPARPKTPEQRAKYAEKREDYGADHKWAATELKRLEFSTEEVIKQFIAMQRRQGHKVNQQTAAEIRDRLR